MATVTGSPSEAGLVCGHWIMPMLWSGGRTDKISNKLAGDVACLGGSMVEHQPRLLGPGFDSRLRRLQFFPFLPKLHFQFPFPPFPSSFFLFLFLSFHLPLPSAFRLHLLNCVLTLGETRKISWKKDRLISYGWYNPQPMRNDHRIAGTTILQTTLEDADNTQFSLMVRQIRW